MTRQDVSSRILVALRLLLAFSYVVIVRELYVFMYADSCVDGGGVIDSDGLCSGPRPGEGADVGARAPFIFWLALLGVPAAGIWSVHLLLSRLIVQAGR
jgi:hypothetical protein